MAPICLVFKWWSCLVFKWQLKTGPFGIQPLFDHFNALLVQYSDPHCTWLFWHNVYHTSQYVNGSLKKFDVNTQIINIVKVSLMQIYCFEENKDFQSLIAISLFNKIDYKLYILVYKNLREVYFSAITRMVESQTKKLYRMVGLFSKERSINKQ